MDACNVPWTLLLPQSSPFHISESSCGVNSLKTTTSKGHIIHSTHPSLAKLLATVSSLQMMILSKWMLPDMVHSSKPMAEMVSRLSNG